MTDASEEEKLLRSEMTRTVTEFRAKESMREILLRAEQAPARNNRVQAEQGQRSSGCRIRTYDTRIMIPLL
jgi:hypothetical protein